MLLEMVCMFLVKMMAGRRILTLDKYLGIQ